METKNLVVTVGLPRSGKTTWCSEQRNKIGCPVVCPDEIRRAVHGQAFVEQAEPLVWWLALTMVRALFGAGHTLILVDGCHTTRKRRDFWRSDDWRLSFKEFATPVDVCLDRAMASSRPYLLHVIRKKAAEAELLLPTDRIWMAT